MDPKYARTTVDRLLADLEKNPRIGRPSLMRRYGRPLGLGLALGLGGLAGCSSDATLPVTADAADGPVTRNDSLPPSVDLYGIVLPDAADASDGPADVAAVPPDVADVLPRIVDAYGMRTDVLDVPPLLTDAQDVIPPSGDLYGILNTDAQDVLPPARDAYGIAGDTRDAVPPSVDASDALPPAVDVYAMVGDGGVVDGGDLDGGKTG
jgi:hypothetical protein